MWYIIAYLVIGFSVSVGLYNASIIREHSLSDFEIVLGHFIIVLVWPVFVIAKIVVKYL